ncbi:hypothetical protein DY000_02039112 [Brassica cretica]|uniref:Uncharacterized protein n=1 Tax=Brassica cretica TaxID=69181 RepID=A0ABQ7BBM4_BRACR|nr:hypothetical protein DY000_02039112 [Brassica cretica]
MRSANPAQKPLAGELNHHAGQLAGELNHHVGQLAGELNRRVVILARRSQPSRRSARRRAEPSFGCTRPASSTIAPVMLAGEFVCHASRLARRARPDPGLSDLLRLPYLPYSYDIRPSGPYTSRFVLIKVILEFL